MTGMDGWGVLEQAAELSRRGETFALGTVVWRQGPSSSQQSSRAIITTEGEVRGWIGGACAEPAVIREAQRVLASGTARLLLLGSPDQFGGAIAEGMAVVPISCQSDGALAVYIEPVVPVPHLVVIGRSPMAHALAEIARSLGWRADLVDGTDFTTTHASKRSMVVVATQGHHDEELVERAVAARPAYLGLVGSSKRGAAVLGYLADRGVPRDALARVKVPAGLDLGSTAHQEIAVAIIAELVQMRASGELGGAPGSGSGESAGTAIATDPVCGMAVETGSGSVRLDHDGVAYHFCSAACRRAFERNPAAYQERETRCLSRTRSRSLSRSTRSGSSSATSPRSRPACQVRS